MESSEIFSANFGLQNKGKENVKTFLDSFEAPATEEQEKKRTRNIYFKIYLTKIRN